MLKIADVHVQECFPLELSKLGSLEKRLNRFRSFLRISRVMARSLRDWALPGATGAQFGVAAGEERDVRAWNRRLLREAEATQGHVSALESAIRNGDAQTAALLAYELAAAETEKRLGGDSELGSALRQHNRSRGEAGRREQAARREAQREEWRARARDLRGVSQRCRAGIIARQTGARAETVRSFLRREGL